MRKAVVRISFDTLRRCLGLPASAHNSTVGVDMFHEHVDILLRGIGAEPPPGNGCIRRFQPRVCEDVRPVLDWGQLFDVTTQAAVIVGLPAENRPPDGRPKPSRNTETAENA